MAKGGYYFPLYYQRLLTSTIGWKDDEFGAYLKLLIYQFDKGSIPDDMDEIGRIAPTAKKKWNLIGKKFKPAETGGLINEVMNEIREDILGKISTNTENGKKGGRPKKNKNRNETEIKPNGFENETQLKGIPITNNQEPKEEREDPPVFFKIEDCFTIALKDQRWVKANNTGPEELAEFNKLLESRGHYEKNPLDYKTHFSNWKRMGKKNDVSASDHQQPAISIREQKAAELLNSIN